MDTIQYYYPKGHENHFMRHHPERPERVESIVSELTIEGLWDNSNKLLPRDIPEEVMDNIHTQKMIEKLEKFSKIGGTIDLDTYLTRHSWKLAKATAGGGLSIIDRIIEEEIKMGFVLARPPGHHATKNRSMGFCLLNNIAIAAEYCLLVKKMKHVSIVDLDLHHGNGTQDIFYNRSDVSYISIHQFPLYPGTGFIDEVGIYDGKGYNVNIPIPPYSGKTAFLEITESIILPLLNQFKSEILLISLGFDAHWRDPLGNLLIDCNTYWEVINRLKVWSNQYTHGKIILFLEGGYDLEAIGNCAVASVLALLDRPFIDSLGPSPYPEEFAWEGNIKRVKNIWNL